MENGSPENILVVVVGTAFAFLGVIQYVSSFMKSSDQKRQELMAIIEKEKLGNLSLKVEIDLWKGRALKLKDLERKHREEKQKLEQQLIKLLEQDLNRKKE